MKQVKEKPVRQKKEPIRAIAVAVMVVAWILLVMSTLIQVLAMYALSVGGTNVLEERPWLLPCWIAALVLMLLAAILNAFLKNKEKASLITVAVALGATALALVAALTLKNALPVVVGNNASFNNEQGLTTWRLIYRHLSSVAASALIAIAAGINHVACRDDRIRRENEQYESVFHFDGEVLFADLENEPRKLKKSQKAALRKGK